MAVQTGVMLNAAAEVLRIPEEELLRQGVRAYLGQQLRIIKADIFEIYGRYQVSSIEEMDARYRDGSLEEASSRRDFQRLDHLEYKRDRLQELLETTISEFRSEKNKGIR